MLLIIKHTGKTVLITESNAMNLDDKFRILAADNAPGQEIRQGTDGLNTLLRGEILNGVPVDFSHGDVDAFPPAPGAPEAWNNGFGLGGSQAYTEYRGTARIRDGLAERLGKFTGSPILAEKELIITPGTQGALYLALAATVSANTKVAVVEPDYFANRKLVRFLSGVLVPIPLHYQGNKTENGPDLNRVEDAFKSGTKVFVFSTPNNPTGLVFSGSSITRISALAATHNVTLIVDQLYARMLYSGEVFTHLRACDIQPENLITILGPSKTESLSGFRLGTAFGTARLIERMERLQAIVTLRAAGYNQAVLDTWFQEPSGWMDKRIAEHEAIRDDLLHIFRAAGFPTATPQAGSYLFPQLPPLDIEPNTFVKLLRHQAAVTVTSGTEIAPGFSNSIRLNFSQDHTTAVAAAERIVKMVQIYRK